MSYDNFIDGLSTYTRGRKYHILSVYYTYSVQHMTKLESCGSEKYKIKNASFKIYIYVKKKKKYMYNIII